MIQLVKKSACNETLDINVEIDNRRKPARIAQCCLFMKRLAAVKCFLW